MTVKRKEYSIARALASFSGEDEARICGFIETMEKERLRGDMVAGWSLVRMATGCQVSVLFIDGTQQTSMAETFSAATREFGQQMVAVAMVGAPKV